MEFAYTAEDNYLELCKDARKAGPYGAWSDYLNTQATVAMLELPLPQTRLRELNTPNDWYADWVPVYPSRAELDAETAEWDAYYDRMEAEYRAELEAAAAARAEHHVCTHSHGVAVCLECGS